MDKSLHLIKLSAGTESVDSLVDWQEQFRQRFDDVRRAGFAWVFEEMSDGLNSVAAPVFNPAGTVIAAVSAHGPSYRFPAPGASATIAAGARCMADCCRPLRRHVSTTIASPERLPENIRSPDGDQNGSSLGITSATVTSLNADGFTSNTDQFADGIVVLLQAYR